MRILTLFLVDLCLWVPTTTSQSESESSVARLQGEPTECYGWKDKCDMSDMVSLMCNSTVDISCYITGSEDQCHQYSLTCNVYFPDTSTMHNSNEQSTTMTNICECKTDEEKHSMDHNRSSNLNSEYTTMEVVSDNMQINTNSHANATPSNSVTAMVLGALVGLLVALLALVITGWIWTYLVMRKRGTMNNSSEKVSRSSADDLHLNNPTYSGDDILHLQPPSQAPTYETIQPNPTDGGKLVLTQQGDSEYNVLNRNQNTSTKTASLLETINEDDIEDSYSKLERTATSNGSGRELVNDGDYSNLETLAIESMTTGQAAQSITASEEGGVMNDKARMEENVMEEASTEEGATQLENKVAQKVGEDEGERQGKEEGEEQQVLLLVTTTTDERKFGNGSDNEESDDLSMTTNPSYNMMRMRNK